MRREHWYIILALLASLYIYLFFRTENTVINEILISIISFDQYENLRNDIRASFPLETHIIYSLPEALWVFCITLTSKNLCIKIGNCQINGVFIPLVVSIGLEIFQLFHFSNGKFDFFDIVGAILFWGIGYCTGERKPDKQNVLAPFNGGSIFCISSYAIVYLAHVWK